MAMNPSEIATLARGLTHTNSTSWSDARLLIAVNQAYERITARLLTETGGSDWTYADFNYTAFPTFTINLIDGQQLYDLHDFSEIPLVILGLEVQNDSGDWTPLKRISLRDIHKFNLGQENYFETDGEPTEYEIRENIIVLYPAPSSSFVTLSGGLKLFYLRTASVISDITDTTTDLGLPSPFVDAVAYEAAVSKAVEDNLPNLNLLKQEREERMQELLAFISKRDRATRPIMTNKKILYK